LLTFTTTKSVVSIWTDMAAADLPLRSVVSGHFATLGRPRVRFTWLRARRRRSAQTACVSRSCRTAAASRRYTSRKGKGKGKGKGRQFV